MATSYFVSGKGVKMWFDGSIYQNPDSAAVEEGKRLESMGYKNITVIRIGRKEPLYVAKTNKEKRLDRFKNCFCPKPKCFCHA